MKLIILLELLCSLTLNGFTQTTSNQETNEIDRLCKKYKNGQTYSIVNAYGSFNVEISINYNKEGKATTITMSGKVKGIAGEHKIPVDRFLEDLKQEKIKKGYKYDLLMTTFTKGKDYTKFNTSEISIDDPSGLKFTMYIFSVENGDTKRIAGEKSEKVDF